MLRTILFAIAICLMSSIIARAKEPPEAQHSVVNYEAVIEADGSIKLIPTSGGAAHHHVSRKSATGLAAVKGKALADILKTQEWYVLKSPTGLPMSVYSVPTGKDLSPAVLTSISPGQSIEKLSAPPWFHELTPSPTQIRAMLEQMMTNAKKAVCGMSDRPTTFGSAVDVSVGIGVQGTIRFDVSWNTDQLCAE